MRALAWGEPETLSSLGVGSSSESLAEGSGPRKALRTDADGSSYSKSSYCNELWREGTHHGLKNPCTPERLHSKMEKVLGANYQLTKKEFRDDQGSVRGFHGCLADSGAVQFHYYFIWKTEKKRNKKQDWKEDVMSLMQASSQGQFNKTDTSVTSIIQYSKLAIQQHYSCKFREKLNLDEVLIRRILKDSTWSVWTSALMNYSHSSVCDSLGIFCWFTHYKVEAIWEN